MKSRRVIGLALKLNYGQPIAVGAACLALTQSFLQRGRPLVTHSGSCAERRVACVGIATYIAKLEQAYVGVVQSCTGSQ
jgi:hypothetical protein